MYLYNELVAEMSAAQQLIYPSHSDWYWTDFCWMSAWNICVKDEYAALLQYLPNNILHLTNQNDQFSEKLLQCFDYIL